MAATQTTTLASLFALIAFAANSVLCRLALGNASIDAASFTVIRIISGAITLIVIIWFMSRPTKLSFKQIFSVKDTRGWFASSMLFAYAAFFSFAYLKLSTASGALILFASVQFFLIGSNIVGGNRLLFREWFGILISFGGFVLLMLPRATQPSLSGLLMMLLAGIAWALYTLQGKRTNQPLVNTAENFVRCIPFALLLLLSSAWMLQANWQGALLAVASGSIASGLGYAVWYLALTNMSITLAAVLQLSVPLIAAIGGVIFVNESLNFDLIVSTTLILSGIAIVSLTERK